MFIQLQKYIFLFLFSLVCKPNCWILSIFEFYTLQLYKQAIEGKFIQTILLDEWIINIFFTNPLFGGCHYQKESFLKTKLLLV